MVEYQKPSNEPRKNRGERLKGFFRKYWPYMMIGGAMILGIGYALYKKGIQSSIQETSSQSQTLEKGIIKRGNITFLFDDKILGNLKRYGQSHPLAESLIDETVRRLGELGIIEARVKLIESDGRVCMGSGRIPLLVETPKGDIFVIKPYDCYSPEKEGEILKRLSGILAPAVRKYGSDFIAEDYINLENSTSIERIADLGEPNFKTAIRKGAIAHARLAIDGINYGHDHWMDEFHVTEDGRLQITDFGTAYSFLHEGQKDWFDERVDFIRRNGKEAYLETYKPLPLFFDQNAVNQYFSGNLALYNKAKEQLISLSDDPVEFVNLMLVLSKAMEGIKEYRERIPARVRAGMARNYTSDKWVSGWDKTMEYFPEFLDAFARSYLRFKRERTQK